MLAKLILPSLAPGLDVPRGLRFGSRFKGLWEREKGVSGMVSFFEDGVGGVVPFFEDGVGGVVPFFEDGVELPG